MQVAIALAVLIVSAPPPEWSKGEVQGLVLQATQAARAPTVEQRDAELAAAAGRAYKVERLTGDSTEGYARRILKAREPGHPMVRNGLWLTAVVARFYRDLGARAGVLARFEKDHRDRRSLEAASEQALSIAQQLAPTIEVQLEGVEGYLAPLPVGPGAEPSPHAAKAYVRGEHVQIGSLERATFAGDRAPAEAERTNRGALRELHAALTQHQLYADMFSRVEPAKKKELGRLQVFIPQAKPAAYLNELVRAALEAKLHTVFVMTTGPETGDLRQTEMALHCAKKGSAPVACRDDESMQVCVDRLNVGRTAGRLCYRVPPEPPQ